MLLGSLVLICTQVRCRQTPVEEKKNDLLYLNHHDSVKYVGKETCRSCHNDKYETYIHTGMGLSLDSASRAKSAASFDHHPVIYDKYRDFYYHPYWLNDSLVLMEYRMQGKDTVHKRLERIHYIIGSGQHTNSHLLQVNGYIFQAPATWYAQEKRWDLPPGFESGNNTRFSRLIGMECMSCHNAMPQFDIASENRFTRVPDGIDCERCHGPGELHVQEKLAGKLVDTAREIDYTIVNPGKLSWERQVDVCQRCHLQGNAVLKDGKDFSQFRPGMVLHDFWEVYMPKYEGNDERFIMASHAQRLQMSQCFIKSNSGREGARMNFTCITCHNPHVSVKVTGKQVFNKACAKCHQEEDCTEDKKVLIKANYDCVNCHMPRSGTEDIPHVTVHDHYIRRPVNNTGKTSAGVFTGLYPVNNPAADALSRARAYLQWYDKFGNYEVRFLDSAAHYLQQSGKATKEWIYWAYLKGDWAKVIQLATAAGESVYTDAWTSYYIGRAFEHNDNDEKAAVYFSKAMQAKADHFDFASQYATVLLRLDRIDEAEKILKDLLRQYPKQVQALSNLGFIYLERNELIQAEQYTRSALALDPDYETALLNHAVILYNRNKRTEAEKVLRHLLKKYPDNERAGQMLKSLQ